ncbi:unannotated protein [freshwater metagenome]|uniref:Unannotated protein n=1 Tax=freshwater metagenome TaxID=449393 RepID=A0A6J6N2D1_9ZZZZ
MILGHRLNRQTGCNLGARGDDNIGMVEQLMKFGEVIRIGEIESNTELAGVVHRKRQRDTLTNGSP